jgi:uncharacterized protein with von Willebrand factor type A (vWA) domain
MVYPSRYRYSRWDGTQDPFQVSAEEILDKLSPDLMSHGDIRTALRRLMQRGFQGQFGRFNGMQDIMNRLQQQRQQRLQQYNLDSVVKDLQERLDKIVQQERQGIQNRLDEARQRAQQGGNRPQEGRHPPKADQEGQPGQQGQRSQQGQQGQQGQEGQSDQMQQLLQALERMAQNHLNQLDQLPNTLGGRIKELRDYDFMDPQARQMFQELLEELQKRMLDNYMKDLTQRLQNLSPEQMQALREMLRDLNQMLQEHLKGGNPNFKEFMQKWGPMFGPNPPQSIEELIDQLQQQMAQMQSLLESLSPEARQQLESLLDSLMDAETQAELQQLAALMDAIYPLDDLAQQHRFTGDDSLTLTEAMRLMEELQQLEDLENQVGHFERSGQIDQIDEEQLARLAGEEARRMLQQLRQLQKELEEAGYLRMKEGRLELTPKAVRRIGQKALREIFEQLKKERNGRHPLYRRGTGGEANEDSKKYQFGDEFRLDLNRTLMNAIERSGARVPVSLEPPDFEVIRPEHLTRMATVLLLDQSRSMGYYGNFPAAKKVAFALYTLLHTQFPQDSLYVLGFSDYAVEVSEQELPNVTWNQWVSGTNMHHALMRSRQLLSKHKSGTRQIIMVTDGEPTAHLENGRSYFQYPPSRRTVLETLKEVKRCTNEGIVINIFMLETSYYLLDFVARLTKMNRGRAFYTTADKLGQYVLVDYLRNRRARID